MHAMAVDYRSSKTCSELSVMMLEKFGAEIKGTAISSYCKRHGIYSGRDGKFKPGVASHIPPKGVHYSPATEFKKGARPASARPVGTESIDNKDGYIKVKVAEPRTWKFKHRIVWEDANGPVPTGYAVVFLDGDRLNCVLENLTLITRGELLMLNKFYAFKDAASPEIRLSLIALVRLRLAAKQAARQ